MELFPEAHKPGYAVYSRTSLAIYDALVLGFSNRFIWRCPSHHLIKHHEGRLTGVHLDIGVGTGYFLDKAKFPAADPEVTLLDPNDECLSVAAGRIARFKPRQVRADALVPLPRNLGRYASVGLNYVLHCLPGTMAQKSVLFDHVLPHLREDGIVFGATILQGDVPRSVFARKLMAIYNRKGIFSNEEDTLDALERELSSRFKTVSLDVKGCVALFSARDAISPA